MRTDDKRAGLKGNMHRSRDQTGVTENLGGVGRQAGYGTPSATAGNCGRGVSTGE